MVTSKRPTDSKKKQTMHCLSHISGMIIQYLIWCETSNNKMERVIIHKKEQCDAQQGSTPKRAKKPYKSLHSRGNHTRRLHLLNTDLHQHNSLVQLCHPIATPQLSLYQKQPSYKGAIYINILPYLRREPIKTLNKELTK